MKVDAHLELGEGQDRWEEVSVEAIQYPKKWNKINAIIQQY